MKCERALVGGTAKSVPSAEDKVSPPRPSPKVATARGRAVDNEPQRLKLRRLRLQGGKKLWWLLVINIVQVHHNCPRAFVSSLANACPNSLLSEHFNRLAAKAPYLDSMYFSWPFVTACVTSIVGLPEAAGAYVPGKAFDRFVTIWLENEVSKNPSIKKQ